MAKWQNDAILDAALSYIKTNSANVVLCTAQPATFSEATTSYGSGGVALATSATVSADYADIADGVSGRKLVVPQRQDVTVDDTGTATHVAIISGSELLYVTTCVSQMLSVGNLVTVPEWEIELRDAV
jgi:hypothetical protein